MEALPTAGAAGGLADQQGVSTLTLRLLVAPPHPGNPAVPRGMHSPLGGGVRCLTAANAAGSWGPALGFESTVGGGELPAMMVFLLSSASAIGAPSA